jgi:hypothetical protein
MRSPEAKGRRAKRAARFAQYMAALRGDGPRSVSPHAGGDADVLRARALRAAIVGSSHRPPPAPVESSDDNLTIHDCYSTYDPRTAITNGRIDVRVTGNNPFDIAELARELDPREWAVRCASEGWTLSEQCKMEAGAPVHVPPAEREPVGTTWKGLLHEVFETAWEQDFYTLCRFDVVLDVEYTVTLGKDVKKGEEEKIYFTYFLHTPIQSKMFQSVQPGGIDVDRGELVVTPNRLVATKIVRFTDLSALEGSALVPAFAAAPFNAIAPAMVSLALHEGVLHALAKYVKPLVRKKVVSGNV